MAITFSFGLPHWLVVFGSSTPGVPSGPQLLASLATGWNDALLWDDSENWTE